nr:MAG TPA: hypothetical protein [Caudoviricetes sp.]
MLYYCDFNVYLLPCMLSGMMLHLIPHTNLAYLLCRRTGERGQDSAGLVLFFCALLTGDAAGYII